MTLLLFLCLCLASISPQKLSEKTLQRDGVLTYLNARGILDSALSAGEVGGSRARLSGLSALQPAIAAHSLSAGCLTPSIGTFESAPLFPGPDMESRAHGADMVSRK
jgi:hypothetical protein